MVTDAAATTWRRNWCVYPDDFMCWNPNRRMDALEQASFRRHQRVSNCDLTSYLDAETFRRLVAPSHFLSTRPVDFLVGSYR